MDSHPVLFKALVGILFADMLELEERFREVSTKQVGPRLARQLLRLKARLGAAGNDRIEIALSREELAQMTGTTPWTVSRLLSAWDKRGLIRRDRDSVTICDSESLRAISE
jgi:CRP-like cAMP-binding protein